MDAIYHRTHLGDALLHALQKLCVEGELEGAEARMILADFNEVIIDCCPHTDKRERHGVVPVSYIRTRIGLRNLRVFRTISSALVGGSNQVIAHPRFISHTSSLKLTSRTATPNPT